MSARTHNPWDGLAAGYALHALEPEDARRFELHAETCPRCADALETDAELLAELVPAVEPPAGLRQRILAIADDRPVVVPLRRRRPPTWLSAAAAVLLLAVGVNLAARPTSAPSTPAGALRACSADDGCRSFDLLAVGDNRPVGAVTVRGEATAVIIDGLQSNDMARTTYVLWQKAGRGPVVALATFDVTEGKALVRRDLRLPLEKTDWLAVSIEKGRVAPPTPSVPVALALVASG
jgi:anti-sigma-K factor RskA